MPGALLRHWFTEGFILAEDPGAFLAVVQLRNIERNPGIDSDTVLQLVRPRNSRCVIEEGVRVQRIVRWNENSEP